MIKDPTVEKRAVMIIGIVSGGPGTGCGTRTIPTVYTRVTSFISWIRKHMLGCLSDCVITPPKLQWNVINCTNPLSMNFNQNQGNSADPGGPLIVRENDTPIIYGWFFL